MGVISSARHALSGSFTVVTKLATSAVQGATALEEMATAGAVYAKQYRAQAEMDVIISMEHEPEIMHHRSLARVGRAQADLMKEAEQDATFAACFAALKAKHPVPNSADIEQKLKSVK